MSSQKFFYLGIEVFANEPSWDWSEILGSGRWEVYLLPAGLRPVKDVLFLGK